MVYMSCMFGGWVIGICFIWLFVLIAGLLIALPYFSLRALSLEDGKASLTQVAFYAAFIAENYIKFNDNLHSMHVNGVSFPYM